MPPTCIFDLETGAHYCPWSGQSSYQFWCFWDSSFRLTGQHLSDGPHDLVTMTLEFGDCDAALHASTVYQL